MKAWTRSRFAGWLPDAAPWVVLVAGLSATAWNAALEYRTARLRDAERLGQQAVELVRRLETDLQRYVQALMGMRDWYAGTKVMTPEAWTNRVHTLHPALHYPGLHSIGFAEFVRESNLPATAQLDRHIFSMSNRLGQDYQLSLPPGGVKDYSWYHFPITWHSYNQWRRDPAREYRHYGMDLNQNPDLWSAINWATGHDDPAISGRQEIDPDNPDLSGLMIFLPVYNPDRDLLWGIPLTEEEARRFRTPQEQYKATQVRRYHTFLRGVIFGSIDIHSFLRHHLETNGVSPAFALYASTNLWLSHAEADLLFDNRAGKTAGRRDRSNARLESGPAIAERTNTESGKSASRATTSGEALGASNRTGKSPETGGLHKVRYLDLHGRSLRFVVEPGPAFVSAVNKRALASASALGIATTLLLAGFIAYQSRANRKERGISAALRQSESRLQSLLHQRERMSRDLHDGTIQSLYAIGLGLTALHRSLGTTAERERLAAGLAELDLAVAELRGYLVELDPGVSPVQSAATALTELVSRLRQTTAAELRFEGEPGAGEGLPPDAVLDLLHATREGVSNALRHGQATKVNVTLRRVGSEVILTMADNGGGFDPARVGSNAGHGLRNLERRAQEWAGWLKIDSRPGGPTRLALGLRPPPAERTLDRRL